MNVGTLIKALDHVDDACELMVIYATASGTAVPVHALEAHVLEDIRPSWWGDSPWYLVFRTDEDRAPDKPLTVGWLRALLPGVDPEAIVCAGWGGISWAVGRCDSFGPTMLALLTREGHPE